MSDTRYGRARGNTGVHQGHWGCVGSEGGGAYGAVFIRHLDIAVMLANIVAVLNTSVIMIIDIILTSINIITVKTVVVTVILITPIITVI